MPSYHNHVIGNLYIHFDVKFPKNDFYTPEKLALLEVILPPRNIPALDPNAMTEEVVPENVDLQDQQSVNHANTGLDDDEDMHDSGDKVQYASQ
jgi:DnaJ family protein A protein 2